MLSTKHAPAMQEVLVRVPGGRVAKSKPMAVQEYNDYMSGVDKSDQLLQYYSMNRKTVKWWKNHLLQLCLINAQKLYNMHRVNQNLKPLSLLSYTIQVRESHTGVNKSTDIPTTSTSTLPLKIFIDAKKLTLPNPNSNVLVLFVNII